MLFGKITGTVVSTMKDKKLEGLRFLIVQVVGSDGKLTSQYVVAADSVGAGVDETVLFATGSSARQTDQTDNCPVDAVIMAIVDSWEVNDETIYDKSKSDLITA